MVVSQKWELFMARKYVMQYKCTRWLEVYLYGRSYPICGHIIIFGTYIHIVTSGILSKYLLVIYILVFRRFLIFSENMIIYVTFFRTEMWKMKIFMYVFYICIYIIHIYLHTKNIHFSRFRPRKKVISLILRHIIWTYVGMNSE